MKSYRVKFTFYYTQFCCILKPAANDNKLSVLYVAMQTVSTLFQSSLRCSTDSWQLLKYETDGADKVARNWRLHPVTSRV